MRLNYQPFCMQRRTVTLSGQLCGFLETSIAESLLRYTSMDRTLREDDPVLNLLQWAGEDADAQVYAPLLVRAPVRGAPRKEKA